MFKHKSKKPVVIPPYQAYQALHIFLLEYIPRDKLINIISALSNIESPGDNYTQLICEQWDTANKILAIQDGYSKFDLDLMLSLLDTLEKSIDARINYLKPYISNIRISRLGGIPDLKYIFEERAIYIKHARLAQHCLVVLIPLLFMTIILSQFERLMKIRETLDASLPLIPGIEEKPGLPIAYCMWLLLFFLLNEVVHRYFSAKASTEINSIYSQLINVQKGFQNHIKLDDAITYLRSENLEHTPTSEKLKTFSKSKLTFFPHRYPQNNPEQANNTRTPIRPG